jgi:hypothetical protein
MGSRARRRVGQTADPGPGIAGAGSGHAGGTATPQLHLLSRRQSFARPLRELAAALRQDVEWICEHTRLSEAAARWQARDRGTGAANDLLLRGDNLADARAWLARRKENAPEITALLTSFLTASEERAAALASQERERLAERERLVAERERAQHNVRRVQRRWSAILADWMS